MDNNNDYIINNDFYVESIENHSKKVLLKKKSIKKNIIQKITMLSIMEMLKN